MPRRSILCAAALIAALLGAPAVAAPAAGGSLPKFTEVGFKVEHRRPGAGGWTSLGVFKELDRATAAAKGLYNDGHKVRVTKFESVTLLRPNGGTPAPVRPTVTVRLPAGVSVVSWAKASQVFAQMKGQRQIAFRYPIDGCYARAHLMGKLMIGMGLQPGKAWAFDDKAMDDKKAPPRLYASTANHPKGGVWWKYHVAPVLGVRDKNGSVRIVVIDPSLFDEPVSLARWQKRMVHPQVRFAPRLDVTAWDQPPARGNGGRFPGKGYWPGEDPADADAAARVLMARLKPLEGTDKVLDPPKRPKTPVVKAPPPATDNSVAALGRPAANVAPARTRDYAPRPVK